jgi:hypothetical protein
VRHWLHSGDATHGADLLAPGDVLDELQRWVLSLPWVTRMDPPPAEPAVERFAVDCPPLGCRSVWVSIGAGGDGAESYDIHLVLPRPLAQRGVSIGWAAPLVDLDADRAVVGVATPTTGTELQALQALLGVGYSAAFPASGQRA